MSNFVYEEFGLNSYGVDMTPKKKEYSFNDSDSTADMIDITCSNCLEQNNKKNPCCDIEVMRRIMNDSPLL